MSVNLPHDFKSTQMSRFIEVLNRHQGEVTMRTLPKILEDLKTSLDAESARIEVHFPYFLDRRAPISEANALMDYECQFIGETNGNKDDFILGINVPVSSLCPCSKAISDYGALVARISTDGKHETLQILLQKMKLFCKNMWLAYAVGLWNFSILRRKGL
jgi:GTP cyclohydrolase I